MHLLSERGPSREGVQLELVGLQVEQRQVQLLDLDQHLGHKQMEGTRLNKYNYLLLDKFLAPAWCSGP